MFKVLKNQYFWLGLIVLFGFLIRLYKIESPLADWHSWRQSDTAGVTRIYVEEGIDLLRPKYYDISYLQSGKFNPQGFRFVEFPIFNLVHAVLAQTFPQASLEVWGRLVSVISSTISAVLLFWLGRRFLGTAGGLLASFFFAFLPFNIYFSRVILPEPMAVTFSLAALLAFSVWFDGGKRWFLFCSGALFALALLVKPFTIFSGIPMLWLAGRRFHWDLRTMWRDKDLRIFAAIALFPVLAWRVWMMRFPEGIPFYKWVFNSDGIRFRPSFWHWIFGERLGNLILGGWGTFPFVAGILGKNRKKEHWFPLVFALSMFAYVSIVATANVRHDYYQTLIIPAVAIVLARGVLFLWETKGLPQPLTKLVMLSTVAWGLLFAMYPVREFYKINHPEIIRAGEAVDKLAPRDAWVVTPYNGDTAFLYQTKRRGWPYQTHSIEELVRAGADFYVSVNLNDPQTQDVMRKFEIPLQTEEFVIVDLSRPRLPKD